MLGKFDLQLADVRCSRIADLDIGVHGLTHFSGFEAHRVDVRGEHPGEYGAHVDFHHRLLWQVGADLHFVHAESGLWLLLDGERCRLILDLDLQPCRCTLDACQLEWRGFPRRERDLSVLSSRNRPRTEVDSRLLGRDQRIGESGKREAITLHVGFVGK